MLAGYSFELQIFLVIFISLLASLIARRFIKVFRKKFQKSKNLWDDAIIVALRKPLQILIYTIGISALFSVLESSLFVHLSLNIIPVRNIFIIFAVSLFVLRLLKQIELNYFSALKNDKDKLNTINAILKLLKISVLITTILILMDSMGINIGGIVAFGGMGGIAIGFAAKDLLSNFFGAIMIYLDKPFKIGDWVKSPDREIEGTVEKIGWRQTVILNFEQRPIYVPNSVFSTIIVENPSRMSHRRFDTIIGIRYKDFASINQISKNIKEYLKISKEIDATQTLIVNFNNFSESSLDIMVYSFTKEKRWAEFHQVKETLLIDIGQIIEKEGASIAFPTITIDK